MPKQLASKPCRKCGQSVDRIHRSDRKAFYYPRHCRACQRQPLTEEQKQVKRDLLNANRVVREVGASRLHNTGSTVYRVVKVNGSKKWKYEHRIAAEQMLGRALEPGEIVHHINHDTLDNRPENLRVMTTGEHTILHMSITSWSIKYKSCKECNTTTRKHEGHGLCTACYQRDAARRRGHWPIRP
jgi:hypothetical protein